jgi:hypothetical protein
MGLVIVCGLVFYTGLAAVRVFTTKESHCHSWVYVQGGQPFFNLTVAEHPPFWPRYWRCLLGRPWERLPCPQVEGRLLDMCEFAHRDIDWRQGPRLTESQRDLMEQSSKQ